MGDILAAGDTYLEVIACVFLSIHQFFIQFTLVYIYHCRSQKISALERFTKKAKKQVKEQTHMVIHSPFIYATYMCIYVYTCIKSEWLRENEALKLLATVSSCAH
jgi:hypothetical protein